MSVTWKLINKNEYLYFESSERGEKFSICLGRTNEQKTWVKARAVAKAYHEEKMRQHQHKILIFDKVMDFITAGEDHIHTFKIAKPDDHESLKAPKKLDHIHPHKIPEYDVIGDQTSGQSHIHPLKSLSLRDQLKEIAQQIDKEYEPKQREEIDNKRLREIINKLSKQKPLVLKR